MHLLAVLGMRSLGVLACFGRAWYAYGVSPWSSVCETMKATSSSLFLVAPDWQSHSGFKSERSAAASVVSFASLDPGSMMSASSPSLQLSSS